MIWRNMSSGWKNSEPRKREEKAEENRKGKKQAEKTRKGRGKRIFLAEINMQEIKEEEGWWKENEAHD